MSFFRLFAGSVARFLPLSAVPAAEDGRTLLYTKGTDQDFGDNLYARTADGTIYPLIKQDIRDDNGVRLLLGAAFPMCRTAVGTDSNPFAQFAVGSQHTVDAPIVALRDASSGETTLYYYAGPQIAVWRTAYLNFNFEMNDLTDAGTAGAGQMDDQAVNSSFKQIETTGAMTITGFARAAFLDPSNGGPGGNFFCDVSVVGTNSVTLKHQNAGSIAANRIVLPGAADLVIRPNGGFRMVYTTIPGIGQRWQVLSVNA